MLRRTEKLAAAARLAATVSHEINNPLEAIGNLIFLARNNPDAPDKVTATTPACRTGTGPGIAHHAADARLLSGVNIAYIRSHTDPHRITCSLCIPISCKSSNSRFSLRLKIAPRSRA